MAKKAATKSKPANKSKNKTAAKSKPEAGTAVPAPVSDSGGKSAVKDSAEVSAPAIDPDVAAAEARDKAVLDVLASKQVLMTRQQLLLLTDPQMRATHTWVEQIKAAGGKDVAGMPVCLLQFLTEEARAKLHPPKEPKLPPRKFSGCEFGNVSIGDQTASIPVKVDSVRFHPEEAERILCGRRVDATIALEEHGERDQQRLPDMEPPRIQTVCDIKSYRRTVNDWNFKLTFALKEIDVGTLGAFAHRTGRCELEVLGDAASDEDGDDAHRRTRGRPKKPGATPHPDVEAGKNKPHGTPVLDAAAKAMADKQADDRERKLFGEGLDAPAAAVVPAQLRLAKSLFMAAINVPLADKYQSWTEEVRDEIDRFAKSVAAHVVGDTSNFLPEIPDAIREFMSADQIDNPVKFAKAHAEKSPLQWHCLLCDEQWPASKPRRCGACEASGDRDVVLIGFYGDPNVNFDGEFIGPAVAEYQVLPEHSYQGCEVRVIRGADEKWRAAMFADLSPVQGEADRMNAWPSIFDVGRVSQNDAIASAIGKLIDRWQSVNDERFEIAVAALKEYLGRIEGGQDPLEIEQSLPDSDLPDAQDDQDDPSDDDSDGE